MNTTLKFWSLILCISFLGACSASKTLSRTQSVKKGDTFNYTTMTSTSMTMSAMGEDIVTSGKFSKDYQFTAKDVEPSGIAAADVLVQRVAADISVPAVGDLSVDSENMEAAKNSPIGTMTQLVGKNMTAGFDEKGAVTGIDGAAALGKEVLSGLQAGELVAMMIEEVVGEAAHKNMLTNIMGFGNVGTLKVGDTWNKQISAKNLTIELISDLTYTVKQKMDNKLTIEVTGMTKTDPAAEPTVADGMTLEGKFSGPLTGTIVVDEKTGWAITSDLKQDLSGRMSLEDSPMGDVTMGARLKIETTARKK